MKYKRYNCDFKWHILNKKYLENIVSKSKTTGTGSVPDPWGFDPDLGIRTTGLRIRILLFSPVAFKMPTKFFCLVYAGIVPYFSSVFKDNKILRREKTIEIKIFLKIFKIFWIFCLLIKGFELDTDVRLIWGTLICRSHPRFLLEENLIISCGGKIISNIKKR